MRTLVFGSVATGLLFFAACGGDAFVADGANGGGGSGAATTTSSTTSSGTTTSSGAGGGSGSQCDAPGQCVLVSETCCGVCGMPTLADMVALNQSEVDAHFEQACAEPTPCPDCPSALNPDLMAYCDAGTCAGVDIGSHPFGECQTPNDCKLRWGLGCCECGSEGLGLTAIPASFEAQLQTLVCPPDSACLECAPAYPADAEAVCDNGHCKVLYIDF